MKQLDLSLSAPRLLRAPQGTLCCVQLISGPLSYRLVRRRRRTIGLMVDHEGITAAAPRWATLSEIEEFMREKERWLRKRLAEAEPPSHFEWHAGAQLMWLGGKIELSPDPVVQEAHLDGGQLRVGLAPGASPDTLREKVLQWMKREALALYQERAARLAPVLVLQVPPIRLSNAATQWGSCSAKGRVLLSWRLAHFPLHLIDYVVAHELAHLKELNHSRRFWTLVARLHPDYATARQQINQLAKTLPIL